LNEEKMERHSGADNEDVWPMLHLHNNPHSNTDLQAKHSSLINF
jgi:hypothetical protein